MTSTLTNDPIRVTWVLQDSVVPHSCIVFGEAEASRMERILRADRRKKVRIVQKKAL